MGWIGCVRCKKFWRDFVARTFAPLRPFCTEFCNSTKRSPMHQNCMKTHRNMSLGSNGVDRVRSLRKILMRLRGTNFCTSSARFAPSFVRQQNIDLGSDGVFQVRLLWKIPTRLRGTKFCTSSAVPRKPKAFMLVFQESGYLKDIKEMLS